MVARLIDVPLTETKVDKGHLGVRQHNILRLQVIISPSRAMNSSEGFNEMLGKQVYSFHVKFLFTGELFKAQHVPWHQKIGAQDLRIFSISKVFKCYDPIV